MIQFLAWATFMRTPFLLVIAVLFAQFICALSLRAGSSERPNIVLIISDDQAWTDYGFMGHDTRVS